MGIYNNNNNNIYISTKLLDGKIIVIKKKVEQNYIIHSNQALLIVSGDKVKSKIARHQFIGQVSDKREKQISNWRG